MTTIQFPEGPISRRGALTARLASSDSEIVASQRLRYHVFYEEMSAQPSAEAAADKMDRDRFDAVCDHLLVVRRIEAGEGDISSDDAIMIDGGELVGSYRLLRQDVAAKANGFYSQHEFDLVPLIARHPELRFLELGRSCVLARHRGKPVVELLWQGIWNYVRAHRLDVMIGCASFEGTDPSAHADELHFLAQTAAAPPDWQVRALPERHVAMKLAAPGSLDAKAILRKLPPLIKGYLRLGCYIGDGAVIDRQFNTIDVMIVLPVSAIHPRFFDHFGAPLVPASSP